MPVTAGLGVGDVEQGQRQCSKGLSVQANVQVLQGQAKNGGDTVHSLVLPFHCPAAIRCIVPEA